MKSADPEAKPDHRYLVVTELFLPTKGGTAVWFAEVFKRLGGKGIHIVTAKVDGDGAVDASHPNSIHRINLKRVWWLRPESLGMYLRLFFKTFALAMRQRFEAIHAIRSLPEGLVAWVVARLTRHPVVVYNHGEELTTWGDGAKYKAMRFTIQHADCVVANSEYTRDELIKMDIDPAKITLIYPGVDTDRFRPDLRCDDLRDRIGLQNGQFLILSVGRLSRRKGFDRVIQALPLLEKAGLDVHFALIGIGDDDHYLEEVVKERKVGSRVHMLGHVPEEDLPRWMNACDLFVMPNREIDGDNEGFGMVYIEAAACGKASVAGRAGGTGSAVLDGDTGLRVDGEDVDAVAEAIRQLLSDDALRERFACRAYERATEDFSWESVARKTAALGSSAETLGSE